MPEIFSQLQLQETLSLILSVFKNWGWFILPLILYFPLRSLYFWWVNWEVWYKKIKWILLEIKPPKEILKPFKAMEDVFNSFWAIAYHSPNWKEKWCEGEPGPTSGWLSCEIVSIGGEIHFYLRIREGWRNLIESAIYSQYPEIEISLVDDYTKYLPSDIPNKDWDLYGEEYRFLQEDPFPIKTYSVFFEPKGETRVKIGEEKIDPLHSLLEDLSKLKPGEQFLFQINAESVLDKDYPWQTRGREIANKLAKRHPKEKPKLILQEAFEILISGPSPKPEEKEVYPPEMKLTPGEKEYLKDVEDKIAKPGFKTSMRALYLAKRDAWFTPHQYIARAYLSHFIYDNLIIHWAETQAKVQYFLRSRRIYLRKRKLLRNYIARFHPKYPRKPGKGVFILNIEELATIFHFPSKVIVPTLPYVEAKKAGPPPELPV